MGRAAGRRGRRSPQALGATQSNRFERTWEKAQELREELVLEAQKTAAKVRSGDFTADDILDALPVGDYMIEVIPRPEVVEGYDVEEFRPVLRREPLQHAEKNHFSSWKMK